MRVLKLDRRAWVDRRKNVPLLKTCLQHDAPRPSGTGKTHISLGRATCRKGMSVGFTTAAALVHDLGARDERRLLRLQKQMAGYERFLIDEPGLVSLSKTGAERLFGMICQRCERGATPITSTLPVDMSKTGILHG